MIQIVATIENLGPLRARLYVKELAPRFILVPVKALPLDVGKGERLELVLRRVESEQRPLEGADG
jgi:hypothetical protein